MPGEQAAKRREATEDSAKNYIYRTAPEKYHDILVPDFPLGKLNDLAHKMQYLT